MENARKEGDGFGRTLFFAGLAGGIYGAVRRLNEQANQKVNKKFGYVAFPVDDPGIVPKYTHNHPHLHAHPHVHTQAQQEAHENQQKHQQGIHSQTSFPECTDKTQCSFRHHCQQVRYETTVRGHTLVPGKRYCLPESYGGMECLLGRIVSDGTTYACSCKFPDLVSGAACDEVIACRHPDDPTRRAALVDRKTGADVLPAYPATPSAFDGVPDVQTLPPPLGVDLYERLADGSPRYYCRCKSMDPLLTSAVDATRCLRDPCLGSGAGRVHASVGGWPDGTTDNTRLNCGCGDPAVTRLLGGGENACRPVVDPNCTAFADGRCACGPNQIFVPCRNRYRPEATALPPCGTDGNYMLDPDAPEAGACVEVCRVCDEVAVKQRGLDSTCQDDRRSLGRCQVDPSLPSQLLVPGSQQPMYRCACAVQPSAKFWELTGADEFHCQGSKPPCKHLFGVCDPSVEYSSDGPVCCHCPLSCGTIFGSSICLMDFDCP